MNVVRLLLSRTLYLIAGIPRFLMGNPRALVVMLISLSMAGFTRHWASAERSRGQGATPGASTGTGLSRMNSYALALLLGGLRGPLVMILWPSAEEQKNQKDLEDFDTKIELIRLLQAEFDTVHLFQVWNKAYNVSAQLASYSNKYRTILDAIDYAQSVKAEKPDDINIVHAVGSVYVDKLGSAYERDYYRQRVRDESLPRKALVRITLPASRRGELTELLAGEGVSQEIMRFSEPDASEMIAVTVAKDVADVIQPKFSGAGVSFADRPRFQISRSDSTWRRTELDQMLDKNGMIFPALLQPTHPRPADLDPKVEWNDGSELQYLAKYQPFPDGISTLALGYNYFKQSQVLNTERKQKHAQISDETIGSRPGYALKVWSDEEWTLGRRAELEAFGKPIPEERLDMEAPTSAVRFDTAAARPRRLDDAIRFYSRAPRLADDSLKEYERHLANSRSSFSQYVINMAEMRAQRELMAADLAFMQAYVDVPNRAAHVAEARSRYLATIAAYRMLILQFYINDLDAAAIFPPEVTKANIADKKLAPDATAALIEAFRKRLPIRFVTEYDNGDTLDEFFRYISRADARLANLN